jgi:hypothetical protein
MDRKPLGHRAYGSIPHLPGSRRGPADKGLSEKQAAILTEQTRDKHDWVIVQEKLDGSCMSVVRINDSIIPLSRSGYYALTSPYPQHHVFAMWVKQNEKRFMDLLMNGERVCGEWLYQAHGTKYRLQHEPFVVFDIMQGHERLCYVPLRDRCAMNRFVTPWTFHIGPSIGIDAVLQLLHDTGGSHGALEPVEGAVWRVERKGKVDFLGKYVRDFKVDGKYFPALTHQDVVINENATRFLEA